MTDNPTGNSNSSEALHTIEAFRLSRRDQRFGNFTPQADLTAPRFIQIEQAGPAEIDADEIASMTTWGRLRHYFREPFAEFWGVFMIVLIGDGSVAQVTLSKGKAGDYQSISWGWGMGVMLGVYVSGGVSGGHLNPAVTLANCVFRQFPWRKLIPYLIGQFLGGFVAAAVLYGNYRSAIDQFEGHGIRSVGGPTSTAGIFCTFPQLFMSTTGQFFSEVICAAFLMFIIFALGDEANNPAGDNGPLILFFVIFAAGATLGWETGYAMNFARDFGPRLFIYMAGYGPEVWTYANYWFWVPIIAPFIGCLLGGFLYDAFIFTGTNSPINHEWWDLDKIIFGIFRFRKLKSSLPFTSNSSKDIEQKPTVAHIN